VAQYWSRLITFGYQIASGKIVFLTQQLNSGNILTVSATTILKLSLKSAKRYQLSFLMKEWKLTKYQWMMVNLEQTLVVAS
jgi:hypothetical protein